jgi:hypothetical protein
MKKLLAAGLLVSSFAGSALAAPPAQVFDAVKKPESVDAQWRERLCALLPQPCNVQQLGLYRPRGATPADYVVLSAEPLAMARVKRTTDAKGWQLDQLHDFSAYADSLKKEDKQPARPTCACRLRPRSIRWPRASGRWPCCRPCRRCTRAAAPRSTPPTSCRSKAAKAVQRGIPFSCFKMIRACFSEKEYKTSKHCHDESNGSLRIAYGEAAKPGAPYDWQYTWLQSEWPQGEPQRATTTSRIRFTAKTTERADFCGGQ